MQRDQRPDSLDMAAEASTSTSRPSSFQLTQSPQSYSSTPMLKSGSMTSQRSSRRGSAPPSRPPSQQYLSRLSQSALTDDSTQQRFSASISKREIARLRANVIVRDWAFEPDDPRFSGQGDDTRSHRTSLASNRSPSVPLSGVWEEGDMETENTAGGWGFVTSHGDNDRAMEELLDEEDDDEAEPGNLVIPEGGGLFLAVYSFAAEAAQEMSLDEGEVVKVIERVCEGWVVAARLEQDEETGLVPEAYLRVYDKAPSSSDDGFERDEADDAEPTLRHSQRSQLAVDSTDESRKLSDASRGSSSAASSSGPLHVGIGPGGRRLSVSSQAISGAWFRTMALTHAVSSDIEPRGPPTPTASGFALSMSERSPTEGLDTPAEEPDDMATTP